MRVRFCISAHRLLLSIPTSSGFLFSFFRWTPLTKVLENSPSNCHRTTVVDTWLHFLRSWALNYTLQQPFVNLYLNWVTIKMRILDVWSLSVTRAMQPRMLLHKTIIIHTIYRNPKLRSGRPNYLIRWLWNYLFEVNSLYSKPTKIKQEIIYCCIKNSTSLVF